MGNCLWKSFLSLTIIYICLLISLQVCLFVKIDSLSRIWYSQTAIKMLFVYVQIIFSPSLCAFSPLVFLFTCYYNFYLSLLAFIVVSLKISLLNFIFNTLKRERFCPPFLKVDWFSEVKLSLFISFRVRIKRLEEKNTGLKSNKCLIIFGLNLIYSYHSG